MSRTAQNVPGNSRQLVGEHLGEALHHLGDEGVGFFYRPTRFVDEPV